MYISDMERTVIANAGLTIGDLGHFAEASALHHAVIDTVIEAARTITRIEEDLREKINTGRRDLDTAQAALDAGQWLNPSGILQDTGRMIDTLAARRQDAYRHLTAVCRTAAALPHPNMITGERASADSAAP
ncbi:hypothetical protein [Actinomadura sp. SCN-SB]|uniref:hypothetical protein n=1 Tax=Actinomadura sp. SCN-SB TaxID=3373092 RepID=UPI003752F362